MLLRKSHNNSHVCEHLSFISFTVYWPINCHLQAAPYCSISCTVDYMCCVLTDVAIFKILIILLVTIYVENCCPFIDNEKSHLASSQRAFYSHEYNYHYHVADCRQPLLYYTYIHETLKCVHLLFHNFIWICVCLIGERHVWFINTNFMDNINCTLY